MATTVANIMTAVKESITGLLGAPWHEMRNVNDLEKNNDLRSGSNSFGIRPLDAQNVATVTNSYMLDHLFEVVLMQSLPRKDDTAQSNAALVDLYDKQDEIFKQLARTKLTLFAVVIDVHDPELIAPEYVKGGSFVALRQQFRVKYRQAI